jgi:hypothetical protein
LAQRVKPDSTEATLKLNEVSGRLALQAGDIARDKGDMATARLEYAKASQLCPGLRTEATQRLVFLQQREKQAAAQNLSANIDQLLRQGRTTEALTAVNNALRTNPNDKQLLQRQQALMNLQTCENTYRGLKPVLQQGQTAAYQALGIDSGDGHAKRLRDSFAAKVLQCDTRAAQARANLQSGAYPQLAAMVTEAKTLALTAAGEMDAAAAHYHRKAVDEGEGTGVKIGPFSMGTSGNKRKAEKYRRVAGTFTTVGAQARALSR